uniref:Uncharacterized protein n=1 Tax=Meloidogyne enterolobii TaxID=390850 RepID=A0A6V7Y7R8_MELEN|nr:unnamed protein product [Meloidogyne enterolobii]
MEDRIENLNEDEISGNFSSILKEFLVFDNDESNASNKQQQLQQKTNNNKIVIPGKDSAIYMWDRKYYKRCPKCPLRQTLEHVMLLSIFRSPRQPPSNFNSAELIRTLEEIRNDERRQPQLKQQKMLNIERESRRISKKDVATETEKTCTKCMCTGCERFTKLIYKLVALVKDKRRKNVELNKTYDKRSNTSTRLNDISEQPEEANLIDLSSPNVTRASLKMQMMRGMEMSLSVI